ncbi:hypothetical protein [Nocardioides acrostichi]|uniref:Uncharacterized protein n=1 Tax=Nocardioides acrostichi TaxID=2784339 RepID=A0A930UXP5_9ACTN|nr:hypothetical protein [Nocardioides acrostichi]MBF4160304.1 hypothetical protein [Nocardioides acrostichi]
MTPFVDERHITVEKRLALSAFVFLSLLCVAVIVGGIRSDVVPSSLLAGVQRALAGTTSTPMPVIERVTWVPGSNTARPVAPSPFDLPASTSMVTGNATVREQAAAVLGKAPVRAATPASSTAKSGNGAGASHPSRAEHAAGSAAGHASGTTGSTGSPTHGGSHGPGGASGPGSPAGQGPPSPEPPAGPGPDKAKGQGPGKAKGRGPGKAKGPGPAKAKGKGSASSASKSGHTKGHKKGHKQGREKGREKAPGP